MYSKDIDPVLFFLFLIKILRPILSFKVDSNSFKFGSLEIFFSIFFDLNNELMKIVDYTISGKKINFEDIFKLTNLAENYNASELTDSCLAKNIKKTANILNENNYSNEDCILIVRTLLAKSKRILKLQEELKKNKNIEQVITNFKPPIFWKDKEIVKLQLYHWPLEKINSMIVNINETELLIKKNSANSLNILSNFIISKSTTSSN